MWEERLNSFSISIIGYKIELNNWLSFPKLSNCLNCLFFINKDSGKVCHDHRKFSISSTEKQYGNLKMRLVLYKTYNIELCYDIERTFDNFEISPLSWSVHLGLTNLVYNTLQRCWLFIYLNVWAVILPGVGWRVSNNIRHCIHSQHLPLQYSSKSYTARLPVIGNLIWDIPKF